MAVQSDLPSKLPNGHMFQWPLLHLLNIENFLGDFFAF